MEEEMKDLKFEVMILAVIVILAVVWVFAAPMSNWNIFNLPLSFFTPFLLIFIGIFLGFKIEQRRKKRKVRQQMITKFHDEGAKDKEKEKEELKDDEEEARIEEPEDMQGKEFW